MWGWGRPKRDIPEVNYAESSEEEDFEDGLNFASPSTTPRQPVHTREGSPVILAHPTLNDNVDEVLEEVSIHLADHQQVEEEIEELTDLLEETEILKADKESGSEVEDEESFVFNIKVAPDNTEVAADNVNMPDNDGPPPPPVNFDVENGVDGDKAQDHARSIKVEYEPSDIKFWFSQLEAEMLMAAVKSQWLKKTILQRNLPNKQKEDVKDLLVLQQAEAGTSIYLDIKSELIRIYAPKSQDAYQKALTRTMTGLPSQLGFQIINDICKKPKKLDGCCCDRGALALWSLQLPIQIRAHISTMEFNVNTYKEVFQAADKVFNSSKQVAASAMVAAVAAPPNLDETQSAFTQQNQPQVAAVGVRGQKPQGQTRGGRNNRGSNRGRGQRGGQSQARSRGPRHASSPPESCCDRHYRHGAEAWYFVAPLTCPWKDRCASRP